MTRILGYQIGLQGIWCACIFGASWGLDWLGPVAASFWILWHLTRKEVATGEFALVVFAGAFGALADLVLIRMGGLAYTGSQEGALLGPIWIVALWMAFATTVNVSLTWLRGRVAIGALLGIVGGIVSYASGMRLGVVAFDLLDARTLVALAVVWGFGIPLLVQAAHWCEGQRTLPLRELSFKTGPGSAEEPLRS